MENHTVNWNVAECLRDVMHFGFTRVHNACSGHVVDVPWGFGNWLAFAFFTAVTVIVVGIVLLFIFASAIEEKEKAARKASK